jgi:hypothetical protein
VKAQAVALSITAAVAATLTMGVAAVVAESLSAPIPVPTERTSALITDLLRDANMTLSTLRILWLTALVLVAIPTMAATTMTTEEIKQAQEAERQAAQKQKEDRAKACEPLGDLAAQIASMKNSGVPRADAEAKTKDPYMSRKSMVPMYLGLISAVYANNWAIEEAKLNIARSCRVADGMPTFAELYDGPSTGSAATDTSAPSRLSALFDTDSYCKQVSQFVGGSYRIEQGCRDRERNAFSELAAMAIPSEIEKHCTEVGRFIGGSYRIMKGCVDREIEAKKNLH